MTPDQVYDYAYDLRISERRLAEDTDVRPEDRKLIQAFMKHRPRRSRLPPVWVQVPSRSSG